MGEHYTVEDFAELEFDTPDDERWELIRGRIVRTMTGGTIGHNRIVQNMAFAIRERLRIKGSLGDVFSQSVKFEQAARHTATYPDVIATHEPVKNDQLAIRAPVVLAEVLSKTSAARDLIEKWHEYSSAPSLRAYVLIEQRAPEIEIFVRQDDSDTWDWTKLTGIDAVLVLKGLDISIPLA